MAKDFKWQQQVANCGNGPAVKSFLDGECCRQYHNKYPDFAVFFVSFNTLALDAEQRYPTPWKRFKTEFLVILTQRSFHSFHATLPPPRPLSLGELFQTHCGRNSYTQILCNR
jgi:hypothetical protein